MQTPPMPRNRLEQAMGQQIQPQPTGGAQNLSPYNAPPGAPAANDGEIRSIEASPEQQARYEELVRQAIQILYGQSFEQAAQLFQQAGPDNFPHAMALVIVTVLDKLEEQAGEIEDDMLMAIGEEVLLTLSEDLASAGIAAPDDEMLQEAVAISIASWLQKHGDRVDPQAMEEMRHMAQQQGVKP